MTSTSEVLAPGALLGAATGLRSTAGVTAVLVGLPPQHLPSMLAKPAVRGGAVLLAVAELVGDKLPQTPERTQPAGLGPRLFFGAVSAAQAARAAAAPAAPVAAVGLAAAATTTFAGLWARRWLSGQVHPQVAAILEDAVAAGLAGAGAHLARTAIDARPAPITEQTTPLRPTA